MADANERRKTPRKAATVTPQPDRAASAPRKPTSAQRAAPLSTSNIRAEASPEEIRRLIAEAAYYRAMERGFQPGHELEDWVEAESEVMGRISGGER
jgi:hypothetical protein